MAPPPDELSPDELFAAWGAAWVTRDAHERARLLDRCCTADVEFVPPDDRPVVRGRDALADHIGVYTAAWPGGVRVGLGRPPETHHGWSRGLIRWEFPELTAEAWDIIRIHDGRIATMVVFATTDGLDGLDGRDGDDGRERVDGRERGESA